MLHPGSIVCPVHADAHPGGPHVSPGCAMPLDENTHCCETFTLAHVMPFGHVPEHDCEQKLCVSTVRQSPLSQSPLPPHGEPSRPGAGYSSWMPWMSPCWGPSG